MADETNQLEALESTSAAADEAAVEEGLPIEEESDSPRINEPDAVSPATERGAQPPPDVAERKIAGEPAEPEKVVPEASVTTDPVVPVAKTHEELEKELEAIEPPKGTKAAEGFNALKAKTKEIVARAKELETKAAEFEQKTKELEERPLPKDVEEELNALRQFQRTFGIENDPEFTEKYDKQIEKIETESLALLKSWDLPDSIEKFIKDNGGIAEVRYSQKEIKDPQNPEARITQEEWFTREILGNMDGAQRRAVEKRIEKELDLRDEKQEKIKDAKTNSKSFIEQRQKQWAESQEAWVKRANEVKAEIVEAFGPAAKKVEVKADATKEEKEQAAVHNKAVDYINETFPKLIEDNTPEGRASIAMSALQARYLVDYSTELKEKYDKLLAEHEKSKEFQDKVKNSGRTAKQSNAPIDKKDTTTPLHKITDFDAMKGLDILS